MAKQLPSCRRWAGEPWRWIGAELGKGLAGMLGCPPAGGPARKEGSSVAKSEEPRGPSSRFSALLSPHPQITRRYAEFSSAIVSINQTFPHERTLALLGQLQVSPSAGRERPSLQGEQLDPEMGGLLLPRWVEKGDLSTLWLFAWGIIHGVTNISELSSFLVLCMLDPAGG